MQVQVRKEERHKDQDIEAKWDYFKWKKQALNHFANNYYRLKMEIGYESGHSSESVSSRNDEDYDHSDETIIVKAAAKMKSVTELFLVCIEAPPTIKYRSQCCSKTSFKRTHYQQWTGVNALI